MKNRKIYLIHEAIKMYYKTEPLSIDLANTVADKVFAEHKIETNLLDKSIFTSLAVLIVAGLVCSFYFVKQFSILYIFLIFIPICCFIGLSVKEYAVMSKKMLSLK
jgi:hypothetical protein